MSFFTKLFSRNRTPVRTRTPKANWFRPGVLELEDRIAPATFGSPGIEDNTLDVSLADEDIVNVEIESANSYDTFTLSDGQLAGQLNISFLANVPLTVGQRFDVLTSAENLADDFSEYQGLGFFDGGLYLKPVVDGGTLSLEVAKIPGGKLTTTVLDVVVAFAGGSVSLSVVSPGVFGVTVENESASAELEISDDEFVIKSASISVDHTFSIGSLFEIDGPTVSVTDFTISVAGASTGTFTLGAASATFFAGTPFEATASDLEITFDTQTSAVDIAVGELQVSVGGAILLTATSEDPETPAVTFSYDPETIDVPGTVIATIASLEVSVPAIEEFKGTVTGLEIRNDGFSFDDATIEIIKTFHMGSIADITNPKLTVTGVDVTLGDPQPFTGTIALTIGDFVLFPGNSKFEAGATDLTATFDFSDGKDGALTLSATGVTVTLKPILQFTLGNVTIDTAAEGDDPVFTVESAGVSLTQLGISGTGGPFQILADGSFVAGDEFSVSLNLATAEPGAFQWPAWLPIQIESIGLDWDNINTDPNDFTISFTASVSTTKIGPGRGLPLNVNGRIENVVIDPSKVADGEFPIIGIDGASIGVDGQLFGFGIDGQIIFGVVQVDDDGKLIDNDRFLLDENALPTTTKSPANPELDEGFFYGGITAGITVKDIGFTFQMGVSELGPLGMFLSIGAPIVFEPVSGLSFSKFWGAVSFGDPIPSITDPEELADTEFESQDELDADEWLIRLKHQVANQAANAVTWADFDPFKNPENIRVSAGASISSSYATTTSFHADADVTADLAGKFIFNMDGQFANDTIELNFRAYVDLGNLVEGKATILFLTNVMPIETGRPDGEETSPISVFGGVQFLYLDNSGDVIENPDATSNSQHLQLIIDGGAKFTALEFFEAELAGTVTIDFDFTEALLTFDLDGSLEASFVGEIAEASGHFTIDFDGGQDPGIGFNIPIIYGAFEISDGEAFDMLDEIGVTLDAVGKFYLNTDTESHFVTITVDGEEEEIELKPLSAGLGLFGELSFDALGSGGLTLIGLLDVTLTADRVEMFVNATLNVGPDGLEILKMHAQGLMVANENGVAGMIELSRLQNAPDLLGTGIDFSSDATFILVFNTTEEIVQYDLPEGVTIPGIPGGTVTVPAGPPPTGTDNADATWVATTEEFYFVVHAHGALEFLSGSLSVSGEFNMLIQEGLLDMTISATVSVFGAEIALFGQATITANSFFCEVNARATTSVFPNPNFEISAMFTLHIDTASSQYWIQVSNARVNLFGLILTGGFQIGIGSSGEFSITIPSTNALRLDFFGAATFFVHGSLDTGGNFTFTAGASFNFTEPDIGGVSGSASVTFTNTSFTGTFSGQVNVLGASANLSGTLYISANYVYLTFTIGIGIPAIDFGPFGSTPAVTVDVTINMPIGSVTPPRAPAVPELVLARKVGSVLYLNMGVDASKRVRHPTDNAETFSVSHVSGGVVDGVLKEKVAVKAFGTTQEYTDISKIVVLDAGEGDDVVKIYAGVLADAEMHGGVGADVLTYLGSGSATIYGDTGTDALTGGDGKETLYGGADGDLLTGGGGIDNLYGEAGNDSLNGDAGNDRLEGGIGNDLLYGGADNDTLYGGDNDDRLEGGLGIDQNFGENGNDAIYWGAGHGADTRTVGGANTDTFTVVGSTNAETVTVGPAADGQSFTVNFAGTALTGGTGIEDLVVNVLEGADTVTINDTSAALFSHLAHATLKLGNDAAADYAVVNAMTGVDTFYLSATSGVVSVDRGAGAFSTSIEQAAANGGADTLRLNLDAGNDVAYVLSTLAGLSTTVNGGAGNDTFSIDSNGASPNGTVDAIVSSLTINGDAGTNTLTMEDYSDTMGDVVHVTPTKVGASVGDTFFGPGGSLTYGTLNQVTLNTSQAFLPDTIYVTPSRTTEFFLRARDPQGPLQRAQLGGDALYLDFTGLTATERKGVRLNATGLNNPADPVFNVWNIPGYARVNYKQIEKMNHVQTVAVANDAGGTEPRVKVIDAETGVLKFNFLAFDPSFKGGVRVAVGDVNGDAIPDIIACAGTGGGSSVRVFNGATGVRFTGPLGEFVGFVGSKTTIAVGDINQDGFADIITGSDDGSKCVIKVFDAYKLLSGQANAVMSQFTTERHVAGGARLAVGDLTGDGVPDIVTGTGNGADSAVRIFKTNLSANQATVSHTLFTSFSAFPKYNGGVNLSVGDVNGDGRADIVVGTDTGGSALVRIYDGATLGAAPPKLLVEFAPFGKQSGGARVALIDVDGDGVNELITAPTLAGSKVKPKAFDFLPATLGGLTPKALDAFWASYASDSFFQGALFLAGGN